MAELDTKEQAKAQAEQERKQREEREAREREQREAQERERQAQQASLRLVKADARELVEQTQEMQQRARSLAERIEGLSPDQARAVVSSLVSTLRSEEAATFSSKISAVSGQHEANSAQSNAQRQPGGNAATEAGASGTAEKAAVGAMARDMERGHGLALHLSDQLRGAKNENEAADILRDIKWLMRGMRDQELLLTATAERESDQKQQEKTLQERRAEELRQQIEATRAGDLKKALQEWIIEQGSVAAPVRIAA